MANYIPYGNIMGKAAAAYVGRQAATYGLRYASKFYKPGAKASTRRVYSYGRTTRRQYTPSKVPYGHMKYDDTDITAHNMYTGGTVSHCVSPDRGTDMSERMGNKIKVFGINLRGEIRGGLTQTHIHSCRIMLVKDKLPKETTASVDEILDTDAHPLRMYNKLEYSRFEVLYDKTYVIEGEGDGYGGFNPGKMIDVFIPIPATVVEWKGDTAQGVIAGQMRNAFYVVTGGSEGLDDTSAPLCKVRVRAAFKDC